MGNDENWIRSLREAGRGYEVSPVPGLWEELEGDLFAAGVARRAAWAPKLWYSAACLMVAAIVSVFIIGVHHNQEDIAPVLTIFTSVPSAGENEAFLIEEDVEPLVAYNERVGDGPAMESASESAKQSVAQSEIGGYGEFSYYEGVIVVENGPDPMNSDCVMVSAGTDVRTPDNTYAVKETRSRGMGGRLYASASGAKLSGGTPISAGVSVDIPLTDRLRFETGLEYTGVRVGGATDSYLGVPVKVVYDIHDDDRMRVYASAGGAVDKSLDSRDLSVSLNAGAGLEYAVDDAWGVFVEPGVEYRPGNGGCVGPEVRVGFRHTFR